MKIALNLNQCHSQPAPHEWEKIKEIQEAKASIKFGKYTELSLQELVDKKGKPIGIVAWYGFAKDFWYTASDFFLIKP